MSDMSDADLIQFAKEAERLASSFLGIFAFGPKLGALGSI